ncbi:MAG: hypothetical protein WDM85_02915 [Caulobacteraceae bacterium]
MIGYVTIGALDLDQAAAFYDAVFEAIGGERKSFDGGWAYYGPKDGRGQCRDLQAARRPARARRQRDHDRLHRAVPGGREGRSRRGPGQRRDG